MIGERWVKTLECLQFLLNKLKETLNRQNTDLITIINFGDKAKIHIRGGDLNS